MGISGKFSDLKALIILFGNVTIKEIIQFKDLENKPSNKVAYISFIDLKKNRISQTYFQISQELFF